VLSNHSLKRVVQEPNFPEWLVIFLPARNGPFYTRPLEETVTHPLTGKTPKFSAQVIGKKDWQ
jgi:hypothetical protein